MSVLSKIQNRAISHTVTVIRALKRMDEAKVKMLFVFDGEQFLSILTIGDIQRAIINGIDMKAPISSILQKDKKFVSPDEPLEQVRQKMLAIRAECMPVVGCDGGLVDVYLWNELFSGSETDSRKKIDLPVVIMAGGKGVRLKPLTDVLPKPLIPVGGVVPF